MKRASKTEALQARVGHAFRGADKLVRWVVHLSERRIYTMLWHDEERNVWHYGGKVKASEWTDSHYAGDEVPAPQPGDTYRKIGVFGEPRDFVV